MTKTKDDHNEEEDTNCDNLTYKGNCEEIVAEDFLILKEDNPVTESKMKSQEDTSVKLGGDCENDSSQTEPIQERCVKRGRKKGETKSILEERHKARLEEQERKLIEEGVRRSQRIKDRNNANLIMEIDHYIPENFKEAMDSGERNEWHKAMEDELSEIEKHKVWTLVPRENGMKVINSNWVYSTKKTPSDGIYKRKARLVAVGCNQRYGVDYKESFSPVLKKESLRTIVALATQQNLTIKTYDVKTAYLYGKCWNKKINEILYQLGMIRTKCDPCVYKLQRGEEYAILGLYVDDLIIAGTSKEINDNLASEIEIYVTLTEKKYSEPFIGIEIKREEDGFYLSQTHYIDTILHRFGLEECNSVQTPGDQNQNLDEYLDSKPVDKTVYQEMIGSLMYLSSGTRPDISFNVSNLSQMVETRSGKMQDPAQERIKVEESAKPQPGATIGRDASSDPVVLNPNIDIPKYDGTEDPRPWIESLEEIGFLYHWADYIISRYAAMNMIGSAKTWMNLHKISFTSWENFKSRLIEDFASDANKEEMKMRLNRMQQWNEPAIRRPYQNTSKPQAPAPRYYQNKPLPQVSAPRQSYTPNPEPKPVYPSKTYNKSPNSNRNRTEDGRPICFKCKKPGHVARYCRVRFVRIVEEDPIVTQDKFEEEIRMDNGTEKSRPLLYADEKDQLKQVLEKYAELFSSGLGRSNLAKHRIDTEGAKPIKHKPYRVSAKEREIIKEQIDEMLRDGIIRPSSSPWSFPVILVKKRDGKYRFCVDYRKLNDVTVNDVYSIPRIDEVLDTLQGSKYFSAIDFKSEYWQVEVEKKDKEKTVFTTAHGLYEFNVMPFGICNAPATFEMNMENMLDNLR
ncbi:hypothetical protein LAZ67_21001178 [Cordylochernes scorpioides]|uniref:CCHC-type domain-containing protein n=1 Tax=Cordylochernes scorpioides TaxID=51811 RepID=A0ABY6LP55_9ARAC|nr:hypothetical protein LAZ67_21001178 [Cordylochernes scorpioides]